MADDKTLIEQIARALAPEPWKPIPESARLTPEQHQVITSLKEYGQRQSLLDAERVLPIVREAEQEAALAGAQSTMAFFADFNGAEEGDLKLQRELAQPEKHPYNGH